MWCRLWILTIAVFSFCAPVRASDVVLGTIVSSAPEKNEIVVRPVGVKVADGKKSEKDITVKFAADRFPKNLKTGETIRVWGDFHKKMPRQFKGGKVTSGSFRKPSKDPTGVRSRLMRAPRPGGLPASGGLTGGTGPTRPGQGPGSGPGGGPGPGRGSGGP